MQTSNDIFTLTPALSLRERENCPQPPRISSDCWRLGDLTTKRIARWLFPLPAGEGQGEGESHANKSATELL